MHVTVIYGTVEGQTRKIARTIANTAQSLGHQATVYDSADLEDVDLGLTDAVIAAAPVHAGHYPAALTHWLRSNAGRLGKLPGAFISVSLSAASAFPEEHREIEKLTEAMLEQADWAPGAVHHAAGALRYTRYDYFKRLIMRHMATRGGGSTDTSTDHEFTDWDALADFVTGFLEQAGTA